MRKWSSPARGAGAEGVEARSEPALEVVAAHVLEVNPPGPASAADPAERLGS
jgi:hypothetical protein